MKDESKPVRHLAFILHPSAFILSLGPVAKLDNAPRFERGE